MTSKWINEVLTCVSYDTEDQYIKVSNILERIDAILRLSKSHTDSEILYDMIEKELFDKEATVKINASELGKAKRMTGTSAVTPITEQEAEKLFSEAKDGN